MPVPLSVPSPGLSFLDALTLPQLLATDSDAVHAVPNDLSYSQTFPAVVGSMPPLAFASPLVVDESRRLPVEALWEGSRIGTDLPTPPSAVEGMAWPPLSQLLELVQKFFACFHTLLPCLHEASFIDRIVSRELQEQAPVLLYAIISLAARLHPDPTVQARQHAWYVHAKSLYGSVEHSHTTSLELIQASCCLVLHATGTGEHTVAWQLIGKAWRQACSVGLNRIDADPEGIPGLLAPARDMREKEERRRTMWLLFLLDRGMSFPTGRPHAVDERQFMVNLPVDDAIFQEAGVLV
jgi:Fungal specific transcription factor domain